MIEAGILGKEAIEHGAEQKGAGAFERLLVDADGDLDPARDSHTAALANAPHDRPAVDVTDPPDAAFGGAVGHLRKQCQGLADRLGTASGAAIDQAEMVCGEQVHEPPGDRAGVRRFTAAAQLSDDGFARRRRPGHADEIQGEIVQQAEIGSADPDRQMFGQMPIRA